MCIVSTDDEAFTYNARISRLASIQEHQMIVKAVRNGVSPERIAAALNTSVEDIRARLNLLEGLHPQAVELLKDKPFAPGGLAVLKKVTGVRQIKIAELMVSVSYFISSYAHALFIGTTPDHLLQPTKPKIAKRLSANEIVRIESEIKSLERDFKAAEASHGENMLNLTSLSRYVKSCSPTRKSRGSCRRTTPISSRNWKPWRRSNPWVRPPRRGSISLARAGRRTRQF